MTEQYKEPLKPPIAQKYVFLAAFLLTLVMILQSNIMVDGKWYINLNRVIVFAFNYLTWAVSIPLIYRLTGHWDLQDHWKRNLVKWLLITLAICFVQLIISNLLYYASLGILNSDINDPFGQFMSFFQRAYLSRLADFAVIFLVLRGLTNYRKLNAQKVEVAQLESQLTESRLEALKMQLNPHFLFNALHAIHSLIGYEDDKARSMVLKISNLLRRILELSNQPTIPLSDELSYVKDYLDIEQERFHDRLLIKYEIADELLEASVPSLILQPLAENALKHGISMLEDGGEILIAIQEDNQTITIRVENSIPTEASIVSESLGIGLSNLDNRLEQLYGVEFERNCFQRDNRFIVEITLPLTYE